MIISKDLRKSFEQFAEQNDKNILLLDKCSKKTKLPFGARCDLITKNVYDYKSAFTQSDFCLITKSDRIFQINLIEALAANCIPIISADNVVLPYSEVR